MSCLSEWKIRKRFLRNKSFLKQVYESDNCETLMKNSTRDQLHLIFQVLHCILHGKIPMNSRTKKLISSTYSNFAKKVYDTHFSMIKKKPFTWTFLSRLRKSFPVHFIICLINNHGKLE